MWPIDDGREVRSDVPYLAHVSLTAVIRKRLSPVFVQVIDDYLSQTESVSPFTSALLDGTGTRVNDQMVVAAR